MRIVVAEDDAVSRRIVVSLSKKVTGDVIQFRNGRATWEFLQDNPADLLITDVEMPELDGLELLGRLRADARFADLPVIIVSGKVGVRDVRSFLESGATAFLPKPVSQKDLLDYLDRYLTPQPETHLTAQSETIRIEFAPARSG
jgi:CheY-like chemotaxis protein